MLMAVLTVAYMLNGRLVDSNGPGGCIPCRAYIFVAALFLIAVVTHGKETRACRLSDRGRRASSAGVTVPGDVQLHRASAQCFGPACVLMPFVIAFIGDSFSMLGGMAFGHKKLRPHVSPNKTVGRLYRRVPSAVRSAW